MNQEQPSDRPSKSDRAFKLVVYTGVILAVVIAPIGMWVAKHFFGWEPPAFVVSFLKFFGG